MQVLRQSLELVMTSTCVLDPAGMRQRWCLHLEEAADPNAIFV
jgi:hypothetical protein